MQSTQNEILNIQNLSVIVRRNNKKVLNKINLLCSKGDFFVILGKNGQGKSTLSLSIANLLNKKIFTIEGRIFFNGFDILNLHDSDLLKIRQNQIGYILQNPYASFEPIKKIKNQLEEISELKGVPFENFLDLMKRFELIDYINILNKYPFELSGGILQRLSAIKCFASKPSLIIADEPTSALDKPVENILLESFKNFVDNENGTLLFITQNISIAEKYAQKIAFLNHGRLEKTYLKDDFFNSMDDREIRIFLEAYKYLKSL